MPPKSNYIFSLSFLTEEVIKDREMTEIEIDIILWFYQDYFVQWSVKCAICKYKLNLLHHQWHKKTYHYKEGHGITVVQGVYTDVSWQRSPFEDL